MQKKVPQFLIVLEIEESTCCMYWLYHKANILMIYYLLYFKNLLISESHFVYMIENIQVGSLIYGSILLTKEKINFNDSFF